MNKASLTKCGHRLNFICKPHNWQIRYYLCSSQCQYNNNLFCIVSNKCFFDVYHLKGKMAC
ncbi:hypothetical protein HanRHA438_Chr14g0640351 [Helianthus annuus]|nr:hypothetical protein HanRHA438_Chr14g0640351 [Helianthus annuus]